MSEIPPGFEDLLVEPNFGHLATVRLDGNPSVSPMWFSWDGELLRFSNTTGRLKARNVAKNPYVAVSVLDPDNPYRYLQVRGVVEDVTPDSDGAFFLSLARRYGQSNPALPADVADRVVIAVRPIAYAKQ